MKLKWKMYALNNCLSSYPHDDAEAIYAILEKEGLSASERGALLEPYDIVQWYAYKLYGWNFTATRIVELAVHAQKLESEK